MSSPQHEPTMEEILASIRKIISEDAPADAPVAQEGAPAPYQSQPDVLELTQEVMEAPVYQPAPVQPMQQQPAPMYMPEPDDIVFQNDAPAPMPALASSSNDIFSDHTRQAMDNAFAAIPAEEPAPAPAPRAVALPVDGSSVETVFERAVRESFDPVLQKYLSENSAAVVDRMKPLIREWMDEHFPALLEGAVRAEVERVVKARGSKR
jgi:cell pole-organizing protein PopZ